MAAVHIFCHIMSTFEPVEDKTIVGICMFVISESLEIFNFKLAAIYDTSQITQHHNITRQ